MPSIFSRGISFLKRHTWDALHPRARAWNRQQHNYPDQPVLTPLDTTLKVRVYPTDIIGREIYIYGMFEKEECRFVKNFLAPGMVFFDIGANLGQYSLLAARQVGPGGKVHSFEPSSRMFHELKFNIDLNGFSNICSLNSVAVSDTRGTAKLSRYEPGSEVYGSLGTQHWTTTSPIIGYEEVNTITLDEYTRENRVNHVDLIKMDIEGAELKALHGATQLLSQADAPTLVVELADINTIGFGYPAMDIWDFLEKLGYSLYRFNKKGKIIGLATRPKDFQIAQDLVAMKSDRL